MKSFWKFVASWGVGPLVAWLLDIVGLLKGTLIIRPSADAAISNTAIGIGAVIAVFLVLLFFGARRPILLGGGILFSSLALAASLSIIPVYGELDTSIPIIRREQLHYRYDLLTISCLVCIMQALTFALLYAFNGNSRGRGKPR